MIRLKSLLTEIDMKFTNRANKFLQLVQKASDQRMAKDFPTLPREKFHFDKGKRYWRLVRTTDGGGHSQSVFCFLDTTNGDVLKAASWKAPAKHARGNIFNGDYGMGGVGAYGGRYL